MRAEVTVTFSKDLPNDTPLILQIRFGQTAPIGPCAGQTSLAGLALIVAQIQFAKQSNSSVKLYFREEVRVIKIHVESVPIQNLKGIRREIDDCIADMKRLAKSQKTGLKDVRVVISTDEGELQEARWLGFFQKLKASATENILTKAYVPVATFFASWLMASPADNLKPAIHNVLVAVLATLLWVLVDAIFLRPKLKYSET